MHHLITSRPWLFQVVTLIRDDFCRPRRATSGGGGGGSVVLEREGVCVGGLLTLERSDEHVPVLDELFDEFIRALQLDFMAFDPLSEVRTVQERVAELQRGESHRGGGSCSDRDKKKINKKVASQTLSASLGPRAICVFGGLFITQLPSNKEPRLTSTRWKTFFFALLLSSATHFRLHFSLFSPSFGYL